MAIAASMAPIKATGVIRYSSAGNKIIIVMPAIPAPEEMPIMWGSARGLRMTACKMAPESDRFRPTMAPTIVLGSRIFQMI